MKVGKRAIHHVRHPQSFASGRWTFSDEYRAVTVLAISGKWAMVRRPRAMPYVASVSELTDAVDPHVTSTGTPSTRGV